MIGFLVVLALAACGSSDNGSDRGDLAELQRAPLSSGVSLVSVFVTAPASDASGVMAFYSNNRYFSGAVQRLSSQHYRISATVGYYEEADGVIRTTQRKTTCPEMSDKTRGNEKISGSTSEQTIEVSIGAITSVLNRVDISHSALPATGAVIEWGCFDETTGAFAPHSWTDVK